MDQYVEVPQEISSLPNEIQNVINQPFFDKKNMHPLSISEAGILTKKLQSLLKKALHLSKQYDPQNAETFKESATGIRTEVQELASQHVLFIPCKVKELHLIELYGQLLVDDLAIREDKAFAKACKQMEQDMTNHLNYSIMKGLIGEYLGKQAVVSGLVSDESTSDVVPQGELLFDRAFDNLYIIEKRQMDSSYTPGERSAPIKERPTLYGYVIGELDTLFTVLHPETKLFLPVLILESKGGSLSSAAVSKQTAKEIERIKKVRDEPEKYALAQRESQPPMSFIDITHIFDLSGIDQWLTVSTGGPIRKGNHQYDVTLTLTSDELELLARYLYYYKPGSAKQK
ncbi:MAG TPA: hypothetical protein VKY19_15750 [Ktedonosporobacter sp.]|nr:hypothetical protein [Ktedonosporobacter sp.]